MRLRPAAIVGTLLLTASLLAAGVPTNAAATAPRCTITGTPGADRLVGTRGNDVICGLGGNDRIFAGGGRDTVYGGPGDDQLFGDKGPDRLVGGVGDDALHGGPYDDRLDGGVGNDRLFGDGGADVLLGADGADRLDGGPARDDLLGGPGDDRCRYHSLDSRRHSCVFDLRSPRIHSVTVSPVHVDVTDAPAYVTIRAHLSDDSGVYVDPHSTSLEDFPTWLDVPRMARVSGTPLDGMWQARVLVPRGFPTAELNLRLNVYDPAGRSAAYYADSFVTVTDRDPDTEFPRVHLQAPSPATRYDVREGTVRLPIRARITDNRTGVHDQVTMCVTRFVDGQFNAVDCSDASRISGTARDGVWQARVRLFRSLSGGDYCVAVMATDRARPSSQQWAVCGRQVGRAYEFNAPLASGSGELTVITDRENGAPRLVSHTHSSAPTGDHVEFSVRAADVEGIRAVSVSLIEAKPDGSLYWRPGEYSMTRSAGTSTDGTWGRTLDLRSFNGGRYYPVIHIYDRTHVRTYVGETARPARIYPVLDLPGDPYFDYAP